MCIRDRDTVQPFVSHACKSVSRVWLLCALYYQEYLAAGEQETIIILTEDWNDTIHMYQYISTAIVI